MQYEERDISMSNSVKCQSLFSFNGVLFKKLLSEYQYPWEILPRLKAVIEALVREGIEGYTLYSDGILIGRGVHIDKSAHIDAPCIIGEGTEIRHCAYLRGSLLIGRGCVIGNSCEVKNSIIMDGAQVPHYNYVGDSVLGERAHLGAGAICSNLRSDKREVTVRCGLERIETGLRKLGAIIGDNAEIGCGTVLCPGTIIGKNTALYPLTMARGYYPDDSIVKQDGTVIERRA